MEGIGGCEQYISNRYAIGLREMAFGFRLSAVSYQG